MRVQGYSQAVVPCVCTYEAGFIIEIAIALCIHRRHDMEAGKRTVVGGERARVIGVESGFKARINEVRLYARRHLLYTLQLITLCFQPGTNPSDVTILIRVGI